LSASVEQPEIAFLLRELFAHGDLLAKRALFLRVVLKQRADNRGGAP